MKAATLEAQLGNISRAAVLSAEKKLRSSLCLGLFCIIHVGPKVYIIFLSSLLLLNIYWEMGQNQFFLLLTLGYFSFLLALLL